MSSILSAFRRKKKIDLGGTDKLARVLNLTDLVALGVGGTLGLGAYILAGSVAKTAAGPATCLSFLVAAVVSLFSGLCQAEFAARVPHGGYAYIYSYVSVGELTAFIIGWNIIVGGILCVASIASGLSSYINVLADSKIQNFLIDRMPLNVSFLAPCPDVVSIGFLLLFTGLLSFGVRESTFLNNAFALLNLTTICTAVVACFIKADIKNWQIPLNEIEDKYKSAAGNGGFLPFGIAGILAGAPRCFFGFVGFDTAASCSDEAKNPKRDIPLAILITLATSFFAYLSISVSLTMAWPYYLQNENAPFPYIFEQFGWYWVKWTVSIGAIFALTTGLVVSMYFLTRIIYAMASDGLIFECLAKVHKKTKTPVIATVSSGLVSAVIAAIFDLDQLMDLMSMGYMLSYTIVAVSVLVLRYKGAKNPVNKEEPVSTKQQRFLEILKNTFRELFNLYRNNYSSAKSSNIVNWCIGLFTLAAISFSTTVSYGGSILSKPYLLAAVISTLLSMALLLVIITRQPVLNVKLSYQVPLVPLTPCISILFNIYLMVQMDLKTWIWFAILLLFGLLMYFTYGISHSKENPNRQMKREMEHPREN